jgi:hypothetical protein
VIVIADNVFCNTPTNRLETDHLFTANRLNAPQAACDAEVARIFNEMKSLPGYPGSGDLTGDGQVTLADLRLLLAMLLGQAAPSTEAKSLAAPADQLTLADARALVQLLVQP